MFGSLLAHVRSLSAISFLFAASKTLAMNATVEQYRVVVVGGGIGGHTAMWELAQKGIGNATNAGDSGAKGLMLIEADADRVCGIIGPITFEEESAGLRDSPFSDSYKPYRLTTHAMRVNIATQPEMRCLANELDIILYFSPWGNDYRHGGYQSYNSRFTCGPDYAAEDGSGSGCRASCEAGNPSDFVTGCASDYGSADLVKQSTTLTDGAPYNLWNFDPEHNTNNAYDFEDEWYGWALGYQRYFNPTTNWTGDGTAYNGAATEPFDANNTAQDHPRHQCRQYGDLYSMYQHYLSPEGAAFICNSNVGFRGDCTHGADPCTYIGSSEEQGYLAREYQTVDEGYPVGSMTEFCTRQQYLTENNTMGVPVEYISGDPVTSIDANDDPASPYPASRYVVQVGDKRTVYADEVIIATEPAAIAKMSGSIARSIASKPKFEFPNPVGVVTVAIHWKSGSENWNWMDGLTKKMWASYRMLNTGSCLNRIEILNTPYHRNGDMRAMRATYTDEFCVNSWLQLAALDNPGTELDPHPEGAYPLDGYFAKEQMRELRQLFNGEGPYAKYDLVEIPEPDEIYFDFEPYSWFLSHPLNETTTMQEIRRWATAPLGSDEKVMLTHQSWIMLYSGWAVGPVKLTREGLLAMYGEPYFTQDEFDAKGMCQDKHKRPFKNDWDPVYATADAACYDYTVPGLDAQTSYSNLMDNEHAPPYDWEENIQWHPRT